MVFVETFLENRERNGGVFRHIYVAASGAAEIFTIAAKSHLLLRDFVL